MGWKNAATGRFSWIVRAQFVGGNVSREHPGAERPTPSGTHGGAPWECKCGQDPMQKSQPTFSPIVELRQYTLYTGHRDTLIELFEREFVESQEALGIQLVGQLRDLDHPDRIVWLIGFTDMAARAQALKVFFCAQPYRLAQP